MSGPEKIVAAAVRYGTAYRAAIDARDALRAYWKANGGGAEADEEGGGRWGHKYGQCVQPIDHYGTETAMCSVCLGSQPLHAARLAASKERGNALRSLLRLTKAAP